MKNNIPHLDSGADFPRRIQTLYSYSGSAPSHARIALKEDDNNHPGVLYRVVPYRAIPFLLKKMFICYLFIFHFFSEQQRPLCIEFVGYEKAFGYYLTRQYLEDNRKEIRRCTQKCKDTSTSKIKLNTAGPRFPVRTNGTTATELSLALHAAAATLSIHIEDGGVLVVLFIARRGNFPAASAGERFIFRGRRRQRRDCISIEALQAMRGQLGKVRVCSIVVAWCVVPSSLAVRRALVAAALKSSSHPRKSDAMPHQRKQPTTLKCLLNVPMKRRDTF
ncbi:hypothetical protein EVAR_62046_1 [Eumeta japonica]|uniref:Uncharacterized protein n=1 Tax=Eumeta variegata TaxID=151549 RepID=A0A4C1YMP7_EUMVA|nr:hypothetical protein EVAR_62046_1 [Eumeta japonica]